MRDWLFWTATAAAIAGLAMMEPKPCTVPDELKVGSMKLADVCGNNPATPEKHEELEHW